MILFSTPEPFSKGVNKLKFGSNYGQKISFSNPTWMPRQYSLFGTLKKITPNHSYTLFSPKKNRSLLRLAIVTCTRGSIRVYDRFNALLAEFSSGKKLICKNIKRPRVTFRPLKSTRKRNEKEEAMGAVIKIPAAIPARDLRRILAA